MRRAYVTAMRSARLLLRCTGVLTVLHWWVPHSRTAMWMRSLLAIYDVDDLAALDTPWWTFKSAELVAEHLAARPDASVFEWGSGASTVWLSLRAGTVTAVEHDSVWAGHVRPLLGEKAEIVTVPPVPGELTPGTGLGIGSRKKGFQGLDFTDYVFAIEEVPGAFDLIVIDGRAREACLKQALPRLAEGGLIVFDNVDRKRYREALKAEPGIQVVWTRGLTPSLPYPTRTALVRRSNPT